MKSSQYNRRYSHMTGHPAIDVPPVNWAGWWNRACALVQWAAQGGPRWICLEQARMALERAKRSTDR